MSISDELRLGAKDYFAETQKKDVIVLHHTVGASARSSVEGWRNGKKIATAYIVERDGTVYEVFSPESWAFHLGLKGPRGEVDKRSIGIEIASEGPLEKQADGSFRAFGREFNGEVFDHGSPWRGYRHFAQYTPAAVQAVCELVAELLERFKIPRRTTRGHAEYSPALRDFQGVLTHCQLRADKSDCHPGFEWEQLVERCGLELSP